MLGKSRFIAAVSLTLAVLVLVGDPAFARWKPNVPPPFVGIDETWVVPKTVKGGSIDLVNNEIAKHSWLAKDDDGLYLDRDSLRLQQYNKTTKKYEWVKSIQGVGVAQDGKFYTILPTSRPDWHIKYRVCTNHFRWEDPEDGEVIEFKHCATAFLHVLPQ